MIHQYSNAQPWNVVATCLCAAFVITAMTGIAEAQDRAEPRPPSIHVTGEATVTVQPDQAQIDFGVVTQAEESELAVQRNAKRVDEVLTRLRGIAGPPAKIETVGYTLQPDYRHPGGGGEPTITGYTATNVVRVTLNDLDKIGRVIDTATAAGVNRVRALRFTLQDERAAQQRALREATANARAQADALASSLGVKIVRVLSASESGPPVVPLRDMTFARAEAARASTPIEPGPIEIRASVSLTLEIRSS